MFRVKCFYFELLFCHGKFTSNEKRMETIQFQFETSIRIFLVVFFVCFRCSGPQAKFVWIFYATILRNDWIIVICVCVYQLFRKDVKWRWRPATKHNNKIYVKSTVISSQLMCLIWQTKLSVAIGPQIFEHFGLHPYSIFVSKKTMSSTLMLAHPLKGHASRSIGRRT